MVPQGTSSSARTCLKYVFSAVVTEGIREALCLVERQRAVIGVETYGFGRIGRPPYIMPSIVIVLTDCGVQVSSGGDAIEDIVCVLVPQHS